MQVNGTWTGEIVLWPRTDLRFLGDDGQRIRVNRERGGNTQKEKRERGNQLKCAKFTDLELLSICCAKETVSFVINLYREGRGRE